LAGLFFILFILHDQCHTPFTYFAKKVSRRILRHGSVFVNIFFTFLILKVKQNRDIEFSGSIPIIHILLDSTKICCVETVRNNGVETVKGLSYTFEEI